MKLNHTLPAVAIATASLGANTNLQTLGPTHLPSLPGHGFPLWHLNENGTVLDLYLPYASNPGTFSRHTTH